MNENMNIPQDSALVKTDVSGSVMKNELRIGNWMYVDDMKNNHIISQIRETMVNVEYIRIDTNEPHCSLIDIDRLKPILINDILLFNLGFKKCEFNIPDKYKRENCPFSIKYRPETGFTVEYKYGQVYLKSVHQLQNLHFALTGRELTDR
jgi:hypothetical protein